MFNKVQKVLLLFLAMFCFAQLGVSQILNVTLQNASSTGTSISFDVMVSTAGVPMKISALTNVYQYTSGIPSSPTPTVTWTEGPTFAALQNPTPGVNTAASRARAVQNPIGSAAASIDVTSTPQLYGTMNITNTGAITFPVDFTPVSTTPNPTMQAVVYLNGATNPTALAVSVNTIIVSPNPFTVSGPAPLELTSFWGKSAERINVLSWETSTEHNVASHVVERSAGGSKWEEVGRTPGLLSSSTATQYSMDDKQPLAKAYYRLRSVDVDGRESISKTILLVRQSGAGIQAVFPSPTEGPSTVRYGSDFEQDITLRVMDLQGRVVIEKPVSVLKGSNDFPIDLSALPAGDYLLSTESNGVFSTPLQIVKI
jgi:hypothetical protein